jgi:acyl dehydratase
MTEPRIFANPSELAATAGEPIGSSDWISITQEQIDLFADATGDHQWIHCDPEKAAEGPFGTTIAHGFLTLSLLPISWKTVYRVDGVKMGVNYGLNKVRFPSPVPVGSRVRNTVAVVSVEEPSPGTVQITLSNTIEIEGGSKPACIAESVVRYIL